MARTQTQRKAPRTRRQAAQKGAMVLSPRNYLLMVIGVAAIVIGFVLMRMENEVDGFISLYVSPILIVAGYVQIIVSLLWRPAREEAEAATTA